VRVEVHDPDRRDELPLADGGAWRLRQSVFAEDPVRRLAESTSHPRDLITHWSAAHGWTATVGLAMHSLLTAPVLVTGGIEVPDPDLRPHEEPAFHVFAGARGSLHRWLETHPAARVQDPASAAAVQATASLHPRTIVDYCAGRGTKTRQLVRLHPDAQIVATDRDAERRAALRRATEREARVTVVEPRDLAGRAGTADLLVLDVPCSNTGVLARRPEAKYRFDDSTMASLVQVQRQIIADALPLLAPSGTLLYATCSVEPIENSQQVQWMCRWHPLMARATRSHLPTGLPGDAPSSYRDGGFLACVLHA
jgi:16S rRNA (cytosine967-C5)-methyltransferase